MKRQPASKPLPAQEWDFNRVPPAETAAAFWYEFSRECDAVKTRVAEFQNTRLCLGDWLDPLVLSLAGFPTWPCKPWLAIASQERERYALRLRQRIEARHALWFNGAPCPGEGGAIQRRSFANAGMLKDTEYLGEPVPQEEAVNLVVNWTASDAELKASFESLVLACRPGQYAANKVRPRRQGGIGGALPFGKDSALRWLGVYRRFLHAGRDLVRFWQTVVDNEADREEFAVKRDFEFALKIIHWLNGDTQLSKKDFL